MNNIPLKIVVWKEGDQYVAWCLNNSISSFGDSKQDSIESLKEALSLYFEEASVEDLTPVEKPDIVPMNFSYA